MAHFVQAHADQNQRDYHQRDIVADGLEFFPYWNFRSFAGLLRTTEIVPTLTQCHWAVDIRSSAV